MNPLILAVDNLAFGFRHKRVGAGFTFTLENNEIMAVLGPNGAGKTTLFRTLLGLLPVQAGHITLLGRPLGEYSPGELARTMTYVPQAHDSHFPFQALDVVLMGRTAHLGLFAAPARRDRDVAHAVLQQMRIEHLAHQPFDAISGGEQQLVLIARALATEAQLFVMDEPTANLDYGNQLYMLAELRALKTRGKTVLLCTHHPEQARQCADRVLTMQRGRMLKLGSAPECTSVEHLAALYGVDANAIGTLAPI